jgi:hypothetical protein
VRLSHERQLLLIRSKILLRSQIAHLAGIAQADGRLAALFREPINARFGGGCRGRLRLSQLGK